MRPRVVLIVCHPNPKSYTHAVFEAVKSGLAKTSCDVESVDLYAEGFDPVLVVDETRRRRDLDKVEYTRKHRELLGACDAVVFVYPVWWGGFPAMLKGYIDRVFVSGLTYSFHGLPKDAVLPQGLMKGRAAYFFYTLDSPELVALLDPGWLSNVVSVFRYCGFSVVKRHYLARLKLRSQAERERWLRDVEERATELGASLGRKR
ncbi:MAG: NAD(P)H-dependent oxidoreductase [Polyangiaceae bacterium]